MAASLFAASVFAADCDATTAQGCEESTTNGPSSVHALQTPLAALQRYLLQRGVEASSLSIDSMVDVMLDWYRLASIAEQGKDQLIFRYGGWSEGCATAFKFSVMRRVGDGAENAERLAGITLMFEPSGPGELAPFSAQSGDVHSLAAFAGMIKSSPAYKRLAGTTPLAVLVEAGGIR